MKNIITIIILILIVSSSAFSANSHEAPGCSCSSCVNENTTQSEPKTKTKEQTDFQASTDDTIHKHVHSDACSEYFEAVWRAPIMVPWIKKRAVILLSIFVVIGLFRIFVKRKKNPKENQV